MSQTTEPTQKYLSDFVGSEAEIRAQKVEYLRLYGRPSYERLVMRSSKSYVRPPEEK
jgi:hypothetical protein